MLRWAHMLYFRFTLLFILILFTNRGWAATAEPPKLRLGDSVRPVRYAADLTLLPESPTFSGTVDIDIEIQRPSQVIWLNANEITVKSAVLTSLGKSTAATVEPGGTDFVGFRFSSETPAGAATLHIQYTGNVSPKNSEGIFQGRDGQNLYLFTQFESIDARRAFPCFDEPNFKTSWLLTLHVKDGNQAFANTPQVSETPEPGGMKRIVFAPSKPLPSYLVAFAVGPFDVVEAGKTGRNHVPVRIITPKGKAYQAKYAAEVTGTIVQRLEDYFGIPYPFEKVDSIAIPLTYGFGAMENAGFVTYQQTILLADPATDTLQRQRSYASVAAHELAHQWFGDLVTLAWWDDTWLNEAFATWTSSKILAEWKPEWKTRLSDLGSKFRAMNQDSLVTTRKIHQAIENSDDISNAFDDITYEKGAAVIRMFETWVGERQFQSGVTSYLKRYSYKNARMSDFLDSIAGTGQPRLTRAFSTFLDQPGFPEISVDLKCDGPPAVELTQKRYLPIGSGGSREETWQVPVCVRYQTAKGVQKECFLLDKSQAEFKLTKASGCPASLWANDNASGYYVTAYRGNALPKVTDLNAAERLTLLNDLKTLASGGSIKVSVALDAALANANAPERQIIAAAQGIVGSVRDLVPASLRPNYSRFVRKAFGEKAKELGWSAKPGEDDDTRLLRSSVVPFVAQAGEDPVLQAEARRLADGWLKERKGVDSDMVPSVLLTAPYSGDRALFDSLWRELKKTEDRRQRGFMINALAAFRDPKLIDSAHDLMIHSDLDPRESAALLFAGTGEPSTEKLAFQFVKANYDELIRHMPTGGGSDFGAVLPFVAAGCDESSREELVSFFEERVKKFTGGPRNYQQALEGNRLCQARKAAQGSDLGEFFGRQ